MTTESGRVKRLARSTSRASVVERCRKFPAPVSASVTDSRRVSSWSRTLAIATPA